jgi:YidC/Oxa1 family membrane protein insertase
MDKRLLLCMLCVSISLFFVNTFFNQKNYEQRKEWYTQQAATEELELQALKIDVQNRTAVPDKLPLLKLYAEASLQSYVTSAIRVDKSVLTLSWTANLPKELFSEDGKRLLLKTSSQVPGRAVVYQEEGASPVRWAPVLKQGNQDLQLLQFPQQAPLEITLAESNDGSFKTLINTPQQNALALINVQGAFLPAGVYDASGEVFIPVIADKALAKILEAPQEAARPVTAQGTEEKLYVLENDYVQLVFSSRGGALSEINLPFSTVTNTKSVVKKIELDDKMIDQNPANAYFPSSPYTTADGKLHKQGNLGGYYPLTRRDVLTEEGMARYNIPAEFYSLNVVSEYPEVAQLIYQVIAFDDKSITFEASQAHRRITKIYRLEKTADAAPYTFTVDIQVDGDRRGLWLGTGVPEVEMLSGLANPMLKYRMIKGDKGQVENLSLPKEPQTTSSVKLDWICNSNGFFGLIVDPLNDIDPGYRVEPVSAVVSPSRLLEIDKEYERYQAKSLPGYQMFLPLKRQGGTMSFRVFAGPFSEGILTNVDQKFSNQETGYNPNYLACRSFHGWFSFISEPFAKLLFILMKQFYKLTNSWAISIILLTVVLRMMLYPLNAWSFKSMRKMQTIAPKITKIQEKYKKDPTKVQQEIMALYRNEGVNPLSGCFPMLIQLPFLIGMFDLLKSSFDLRGSVFIPGWIDNLTAPDVLFTWTTSLPLIGNEFHLLPILLGAVMFVQQKFMSPATAPDQATGQLTDTQRQQKAMGTIMPIFFTVMFYKFAAGLNIYWLSSMILGVLQQWYTNRQMDKDSNQANDEKKNAKAIPLRKKS